MANPLAGDLDHILDHTAPLWEQVRGKRIFITGGTGFVGCWLLESLAWANDRLDLSVRATVLTRNPGAFRRYAPHLASHPVVQLCRGDVRTFEFPPGEFSHVIHAASEESTKLNAANPLLMVDTLVEGTRQALEFARFSGAKAFLLTSSGAVYGRQPAELLHIPEEYAGGPDPLSARAAYAEGKRAAELLCAVYARQHGIEPKIARGFAFIGPYLPLDGHFAAGNFVRDGIRGGPINVQSDGTPYRTYLYAADLAIWLWTILFRGAPGRAYNVGSEEAISIAGLAAAVAAAFDPPPPVRIAGTPTPGKPVERYVPSVQRAQSELQLRAWVSLPEAIRRTVRWAST